MPSTVDAGLPRARAINPDGDHLHPSVRSWWRARHGHAPVAQAGSRSPGCRDDGAAGDRRPPGPLDGWVRCRRTRFGCQRNGGRSWARKRPSCRQAQAQRRPEGVPSRYRRVPLRLRALKWQGRCGQVVGVTRTDGELLAAAARGDGAAFSCFYRRTEHRLLPRRGRLRDPRHPGARPHCPDVHGEPTHPAKAWTLQLHSVQPGKRYLTRHQLPPVRRSVPSCSPHGHGEPRVAVERGPRLPGTWESGAAP